MNVLYLGRKNGTSEQRKAALVRLGHQVTHIDPHALLPSNRLISLWEWRTGFLGLAEIIRRRVIRTIDQTTHTARLDTARFDLCWIDHGSFASPGLVKELKARITRVVCYNIDDPFGGRDRQLWRQFHQALPYYDLVVVVRACNIQEAYDRGANKVIRVFRSADEVAHAPRQLTPSDHKEWASQVVFVGTAFPERGPFLAELIERGVPLTLYGARYPRLPEWPLLKPHWRPGNTDTIDGYAKAISASRISLGLLSKGNRDHHTTRSLEIPSLGALFCAQRTDEHLALYDEGREAIFWDSPEECAAKCLELLADEPRRAAIVAAGHERFLKDPWQNMKVIESILNAAVAGPPTPAHGSNPQATQGKLPEDAGDLPAGIHVNPPSRPQTGER